MSTLNNVVSLDDWRVKVRGSNKNTSEDLECDLESINSERAVLKSDADVGRFAWLHVNLPDGSDVPWWRVVAAGGRLSQQPGAAELQAERLATDGVDVRAGRVQQFRARRHAFAETRAD